MKRHDARRKEEKDSECASNEVLTVMATDRVFPLRKQACAVAARLVEVKLT